MNHGKRRSRPWFRLVGYTLLCVALLPMGMVLHGWLGGVTGAGAHPNLYVPILIQEARAPFPGKQDMTLQPGRDRVKAPLTVGLPIDPDTTAPENALREIDQAVLLGPKDMQFRILQRWEDNQIKWVLVDTQIDLKAGKREEEVYFVYGKNRGSKNKMAQDKGGIIEVDTGIAQFSLRKQGFNLFDRVVVRGKELVAPGSSAGIVLVGEQGKEYSAAKDAKLALSIEENGSVRAVVKAKGTHVDAQGKSLLAFTLRIHFYKGKSYCRAFFSLRNASKDNPRHVLFKSLRLELSTTLTQVQAVMAGPQKPTPLTLTAKGSARLVQNENAYPQRRDPGYDKTFWPTAREGYVLQQDGKPVAQGKRDQIIDLFYAQARNQSQGPAVTIGTRFAAARWPQALQVQADGHVRVELFPQDNDKPFAIAYRSYRSFEVMFGFEDKATDASDQMYRFQYPLIGRPKFTGWLNDSYALWGFFYSFQEEADFANAPGRKWPVTGVPEATNDRRPSWESFRYVDQRLDRAHNQYDPGVTKLFSYLRQERGFTTMYYLQAERYFRHLIDRGLPHSDDFRADRLVQEAPALVDAKGNAKSPAQFANSEKILWQGRRLTSQRDHGYGLRLWYYLTGDEHIRDQYLDWAETLRAPLPVDVETRSLGWRLYNLVDVYRHNKDKAYLTQAWSLIDRYFQRSKQGEAASQGIDAKRGFWLSPAQAKAKRSIVRARDLNILLRALAYLHDFGTSDETQAQRARDLLEGLSLFVLQEMWVAKGKALGQFGLRGLRDVSKAAPDATTQPTWQGGQHPLYLAMYYGYILTQNPNFLRRGEQLLQIVAHNKAGIKGTADRPGRQTLQSLLESSDTENNTSLVQTWRDFPILVQKQSDGSYQLSWRLTRLARAMVIKVADKEIVPSLDYDPSTQRFGKSPSQHIPFFAASTLKQTLPKIRDEATHIYRLTVTGLDPKKEHFFAGRFRTNVPFKPKAVRPSDLGETMTEGGRKEKPSSEKGDAGTGAGGESNTRESTAAERGQDAGSNDGTGGPDGCGCAHTSSPSTFSWWVLCLLLFALQHPMRQRRRRGK